MAVFSTLANRLKYERQLQFPDHAESSYSRAAQLDLDAIPFAAVPLTAPAGHSRDQPIILTTSKVLFSRKPSPLSQKSSFSACAFEGLVRKF